MLSDRISWPKGRRYKTGSDWEPVGFFSDCFCNSTTLDLMLGYFSSSAISVLSDGFAVFLHNGGRMRLVINDILTDADRDVVLAAQDGRELPVFDLCDIAGMQATLSARDQHFFDCLAWLIRNDRIELCIVSPINGEGVAHTKCGVFCDGVSKVGFDGSVNFSLSAFLQNKEGLTVDCSWDNEIERNKIADIEEEFEKTFSGRDETVRYIDAKDVRTHITSFFGEKDLLHLLLDEYDILEQETKQGGRSLSASVSASLSRAKERVQKAISTIQEEPLRADCERIDPGTPRFPFPSGPKEYQERALQNWKKNRQRGLFNMATGTGKTVTALNCLLEIYKKLGYYKALILVPTITLVEQWEDECRHFRFANIIQVCSKNSRWSEEVASIVMAEGFEKADNRLNYVIVCTYASFVKDKVFSSLSELSHSKVLLIADEAHNMGSESLCKKFNLIPFKRRIGLSATPDRQFDEGGNNAIRSFFHATEGFTFEYTMEQAIGKALCKYEYYPHVVPLTPEEMVEYKKISVKLAKLYNKDSGSFPEKDENVKRLLLQRKAIIHKAYNKLAIFKDIVEQRLREKGNLKYTLVYAPEGSIPDSWDSDCFTDKDYISDDVATDSLIEAYNAIIRDASPTVTVRKFTSESVDRDTMLKDFASGELQVLTSMRCLDEGVDVPRSEFAIFCASTGNPRQFIQRRGRILRKHPDKKYAIIHDLVAIPEIIEGEDNYLMEKNLLKGEIRRVKNFALLSMNANDTVVELDNVLDYYNISLFEN